LVLGGLGREFARLEISPRIERSSDETADAVAEILIRGLEAG
jgi:hypothetical protein